MQGVAGVTERIAAIQERISQLSPQRTSGTSFDSVLGMAVLGQLSTAASTTSSAATSGVTSGVTPSATATAAVGSGLGAVDSKNIPIELKAYGNGHIPSSALSPIAGTSHELWTPAARSFEAMRAAAAADGVTIGITDSYRTYDTQVSLVQRKGLYSQGGLAAEPGTSRHGWGVALDLKLDSSAQSWIRANGATYGYHENVGREPWHWEYEPFKA